LCRQCSKLQKHHRTLYTNPYTLGVWGWRYRDGGKPGTHIQGYRQVQPAPDSLQTGARLRRPSLGRYAGGSL
ncbi:MAG: hypothetical protein ACK53Y_04580, partial [bacterium]